MKWRRTTSREVFAESAVTVPGPADRVWALLQPPTFAVALGSATDAWRDPDTPVGVGEIQVYVTEVEGQRRTSRQRVVEYDAGRRAVTESLEGGFQQFAETTVTPLGDGASVRVTHRGWFVLARDTPPQLRSALQSAADQWAARITDRLPGLCDPRR